MMMENAQAKALPSERTMNVCHLIVCKRYCMATVEKWNPIRLCARTGRGWERRGRKKFATHQTERTLL